jgi:hypothetical protein
LAPSEVTAPIGMSRNSPEDTAHCKGVLTNGFRVDYISSPGFRGTDQFQIQFAYGRYADIDNYTINVPAPHWQTDSDHRQGCCHRIGMIVLR